MRKVIFAINMTIDGYCDHRSGIADDELHEYYTRLLQGVDVVLLGRKTYELMYPYWPAVAHDQSETKAVNEFARAYDSLERIVFSNTMTRVEWKNTRISRANPEDEILKLRQMKGKDISVGSLSIAWQLTKLGRIDEYHIAVHPILAGKGPRLFEGSDFKEDLRLNLIGSKTLRSGVIALHYSKQ